MGIYDVPAAGLIEEVAKDLKGKITQPSFAAYVKTGHSRERAPTNPDWFYHRAASVLYRIYKNGALGTGALRSYYGGRKNRGVRPEHKVKASGKIIRLALQSLEKEGLVKKDKKGRKITAKGEKLLFAKAKHVEIGFKAEMEKGKAELAERLGKAEQARKKVAEQLEAQEAARKAAAEQAKKLEAQRAAAAGAQGQEGVSQGTPQASAQRPAPAQRPERQQAPAQEKRAESDKGNKPGEKKDGKDFAPAG